MATGVQASYQQRELVRFGAGVGEEDDLKTTLGLSIQDCFVVEFE